MKREYPCDYTPDDTLTLSDDDSPEGMLLVRVSDGDNESDLLLDSLSVRDLISGLQEWLDSVTA